MTAKKFVFDVSWVFVSQIITLVINLLFYVIVGRYLGPGPLGLYTLTVTIYNILGIVAGVGIPQAITKFVAEQTEDEKSLNSYIYSSIINTGILGIFVGLLLFIFSGFIADIYQMPDLKVLLQIIAIAIPFLVVNNTLLGIFNGLRKMKSYTLRTVFRAVLMISFTILFLIYGFGVTGVILAVLISEVATFLIMIMLSLHYFTFSLDLFTDHSKIILKFGSYLLVSTILYTLLISLDKLLIGYFLNDSAIGIYGIAYYAANLLLMIPNAISTVTYPSISALNKAKQHLIIQNLAQRSMRFCVVILSLLGLLMVFFAKPVILLLLKPSFLEALTPLAFLIIGNIFVGGGNSVGSSYIAMGKPELGYKINIVELLVSLALYLWLIPILGIIGAAIGTAIVQIFTTFVGFFIFQRYLNIKLEAKRYILSGSIAGVLILAFVFLEHSVNIYLLAIVLLAIYVLICVKFMLTKDDLQNVKHIIKHRSFSGLFAA